MKRLFRGFWLGVIAHAGCNAGFQDTLGLDAYIDYVRRNWVSFPPYVGFGICAFAVALVAIEAILRRARRSMRDELDAYDQEVQ